MSYTDMEQKEGDRNVGDSRRALAWPMVVLYGGGAIVYAAWQLAPTKGFIESYWRSVDPDTLQRATGETVPLGLTVGALCTHRNLRLVQRWRGLPEERPLTVLAR